MIMSMDHKSLGKFQDQKLHLGTEQADARPKFTDRVRNSNASLPGTEYSYNFHNQAQAKLNRNGVIGSVASMPAGGLERSGNDNDKSADMYMQISGGDHSEKKV